MPWAAIAYDSFVWWATAGERTGDVAAELARDEELWRVATNISSMPGMHSPRRSRASSRAGATASTAATNAASASKDDTNEASGAEIKTIIAYFHHMTSGVLSALADLVDEQTDDSTADGQVVHVMRQDLVKMGLDVWSRKDREFVARMLYMYFGVHGHVEGASVECCGVKLY